MKENIKKFVVVLLIIIALAGISFGVYKVFFDKEEKIVLTEDEKKFKEEYESLNGTVRESTGVENPTMHIKDDNNVKYFTDEETVKFLEKGTGVLYMGFKECPWCRNAVPVIVDVASNVGIENVYYLDVTDIKSTIILDAKNKAQITKKGTDAYYKIMELLDDYLNDYSLKTKDGKTVPTGEKRIYSPTVVVVKDGVVVGFHVGTVDGHDKDENGVLPDMTKEQKEELIGIYEEMFTKVSGSSCNDGCE